MNLEIFIIQGIHFNQSPGAEVIVQFGNEKFTFTIERPLLSDFLLSEKLGDATKIRECLQNIRERFVGLGQAGKRVGNLRPDPRVQIWGPTRPDPNPKNPNSKKYFRIFQNFQFFLLFGLKKFKYVNSLIVLMSTIM